jgi:hypothetical protein
MLASENQRFGAWIADGSGMPRSLDPPESGIRCGPKGQDERAAYKLSLSTILFVLAKGVSHFEPETGQPR